MITVRWVLQRAGMLAAAVQGVRIDDPLSAAAFATKGLSRCQRSARTFCLVAFLIVAASGLVSYASHEGHLFILSSIRFATMAILAGISWTLGTSLGHRRPKELALLAIVVVTVTTLALASYVEGAATYQHGRLNILILGAAVLITWGPAWSALASFTVVALYVVGCAAAGQFPQGAESVREVGFLIISSVAAVGIAAVREQRWGHEYVVRASLAQTRRELAEKEHRYRSLFEEAGSAIVVLAADHRILEFNPEAERIYGRRREDVVGKSYLELFVPKKAWGQAARVVERVLTGRPTRVAEGEIRTPGGEKRVLLWRTACLPDPDGRVAALLAIGQDITAHKEAERARGKSEARYRFLVDQSQGFIGTHDLAGRFLSVNPAGAQAIGYEPAELVGKDIRELLPPERRGAFDRYLERIQHDGTSAGEMRVITKAGDEHFWVYRNVLHREDGAHSYVLMHAQDISERKRAETALRESEGRLRRLVEGTRAIPWEADAVTWRFTYVGPQAVDVLGYPIEQWYEPGFWARHIHPNDRERALAFCLEASAHFTDYEFDYRMVAADGRIVWLQDIVSVESVGEKPRNLRGFMVDVTERKRAEEALAVAQAEYEDLYENAPNMFVAVDYDTGRIVQCNQAVTATTGYARAEIIGRSMLDMYHPDCLPRARETFSTIATTGSAHDVELQLKHKSGTKVDVSLSVSTTRDEQGRVRYVRGAWVDITGRKRAEEALQRSEERYKAIVEDQTELICRCTPQGVLTFVNDAYCRYFRQTREALLGHSWKPTLAKGDERDVMQLFATLRPEHPLATVDLRIVGPDGDIRWQQWINRAIFDAEEHVVEYQSVGRDITDREKAKEEIRKLNADLQRRVVVRTAELEESEGRFRGLFETAPIAMAVAGDGGQLVDTNEAFQKLFGYTEDELRGITLSDLSHPEDVDMSLGAYTELWDGKGHWRPLEKRYVHRNGHVIWANTSVVATRQDPRGTRRVFAMIEDVTERKREETLQTAERSALEVLACGGDLGDALATLVVQVEKHEPELLCSVMVADEQGACLRHGAAPGLPDDYNRAVDGIEIGPAAGSCGTAAYRRQPVVVEDIVTDPLWRDFRDLGLRHGLRACWSHPIMSSAGQLLGTFAMYYEKAARPTESQIRLIEGAARAANIVIERKQTDDRTRHHQAELAHAGRMSLVGELAAGLAHELHQPLAAIVNYAAAGERRIREGTAGRDELVDVMQRIRDVALRGGEITRRMRRFARKGESPRELVDVNELARSAASLAEPEARRYGVTLRLDLGANLPQVEADRIQIEQVILNLITNGLEAMIAGDANGAQLTIQSGVCEDGTISLAVRDAGSGLRAGIGEKMFDPFFTTKPSGLGMGLSISRSIIEAHEGRMWVRPNPGAGATVGFVLPIVGR